MKIWYINTFSKGNHHEIYNASILKLCTLCSDEVVAISDKKTLANYCELANIQDSGIHKHSIYCFGQKKRLFLLLSYIWSAMLNIVILFISKRDSVLIYVFNNSFSTSILNRINMLLKRNVLLCLHGELELLSTNQESRKYGVLSKILQFLIIHYFRGDKYSLKMLLMGDSIKRNLEFYLKKKIFNIFVLDHPYIQTTSFINIPTFSSVLKLGTVGTMSVNKGADKYISLLQMVKAEKLQNLQFYVIGKAEGDVYDKLNAVNVIFPCVGEGMCSRESFDKHVSDLDYILFFYPVDSYRLTASGAIYDAIMQEIPIISIKNEYFTYLFDKYGKFGYLFDNVDNIFSFIKSGLKRENDFFNFLDIKQKISPEAFLEDFVEIIKK